MDRPAHQIGLQPIIDHLERLASRAPLPLLYELLKGCPAELCDVAVRDALCDVPQRCRVTVAQGSYYILYLARWTCGKVGPIHNHMGSSCAFKVIHGTCLETIYGYTAENDVYPVENHLHGTGAVVANQDFDIHRISNTQTAGDDLITLHVSSPPLSSKRAFALLGMPGKSSPLTSCTNDALVGGDGI